MTPQDMRERAAQWLEKAHQGWSNSECVPLGAIAIWIRAIRAIPIPEPTKTDFEPTADDVVVLKKALAQLGVSSPASMEELGFAWLSYVRLVNGTLARKFEQNGAA